MLVNDVMGGYIQSIWHPSIASGAFLEISHTSHEANLNFKETMASILFDLFDLWTGDY